MLRSQICSLTGTLKLFIHEREEASPILKKFEVADYIPPNKEARVADYSSKELPKKSFQKHSIARVELIMELLENIEGFKAV